jgi:hypothetical protein
MTVPRWLQTLCSSCRNGCFNGTSTAIVERVDVWRSGLISEVFLREQHNSRCGCRSGCGPQPRSGAQQRKHSIQPTLTSVRRSRASVDVEDLCLEWCCVCPGLFAICRPCHREQLHCGRAHQAAARIVQARRRCRAPIASSPPRSTPCPRAFRAAPRQAF